MSRLWLKAGLRRRSLGSGNRLIVKRRIVAWLQKLVEK
jgi:hypothetical protein